jgi:hypothetical protein
MLLMRSVDLKKNTLDVVVDTIDCESKVLNSISLCIRFKWFFLCWVKVASRSMCKQHKSWGVWCVIILIILQVLICCNPTFRRVWGWHSHSWNGDLGVLRDSQNFRIQLQGSKHLALRRSLYHWKTIEAQMSKVTLHEPFGHLQHKLWQKEGSRVKLTVWLLTTKSRESTRPRCVQVECDMMLESFQGKLQVCFGPHPNRRYEQRVMNLQSPGSPNQDSFGTPLWESQDKKPFGCRCRGETQRILYGGRWWFPPSPGHGESCESRVIRGLF